VFRLSERSSCGRLANMKNRFKEIAIGIILVTSVTMIWNLVIENAKLLRLQARDLPSNPRRRASALDAGQHSWLLV
jgi:hypothetical protein